MRRSVDVGHPSYCLRDCSFTTLLDICFTREFSLLYERSFKRTLPLLSSFDTLQVAISYTLADLELSIEEYLVWRKLFVPERFAFILELSDHARRRDIYGSISIIVDHVSRVSGKRISCSDLSRYQTVFIISFALLLLFLKSIARA